MIFHLCHALAFRCSEMKAAVPRLILLAAFAGVALAGPVGKDGGSTGAFTYSTNPSVAGVQREAKAVAERYQEGLKSSNFASILPLFAPDAVAEWNDKGTVIGRDAMATPYQTLFKEIKFATDFQYDAVDIYGDLAIVRTHHPVGQIEVNVKDGSKKLDFNREIFVLQRKGGDWKIILYTFNVQPKQGQQ